jgi:hypothetical protein
LSVYGVGERIDFDDLRENLSERVMKSMTEIETHQHIDEDEGDDMTYIEPN